jgi:hypothetical protein
MKEINFSKFYKIVAFPAVLCCMLFSISCSNGQTNEKLLTPDAAFGDYWYQGLAEISSYELNQSRYGETRPGKAVLVFVTEDFSKNKHVKLDNPGAHPKDKITVLKLNFMRNFQTGIYPYSIMASSFMPVSNAPAGIAEKSSVSVQEWCGHVFDQVYKDGKKYKRELSSYFESEGEKSEKFEQIPLEQALWNSIRIDPTSLPVGPFEIIPDQVYSRLMHQELRPVQVLASVNEVEWNSMNIKSYVLNYPGEKRQLSIYFQPEFPYIIEGWEDQYFDIKGNIVQSSGKRIKTIQLDYWSKNANEFNFMHEALFKPSLGEQKK